MDIGGDVKAERFVRGSEDVLRRRYGDDAVRKLIEVLTPAREEGTIDLPLAVYDEKGNMVARIVDLKYEFVKGKRKGKRSAGRQVVSQCTGEDCCLRIIVKYETEGERGQLKMEWYWAKGQKKKGEATVTYYYERANISIKNDVEVAVLKALTGKSVEKGKVAFFAEQLNALRRFKQLRNAIDEWRRGKPTPQHVQSPKQ
ncbi:hypothetical protein CGL51_12765 [Pyrobaculum aerophilum]|uniref:PaRep2b domain-containing protein n=1 Tax=Pyrobaculum aerophilum TaxID=13773 RepID=A0A371QY77_9CREN|nr:hypothetical protein CGL51_12765 [Pyrobaculum aerophilum]RFA95647.1 hypothetical protein CGL52_12520 [Pyrobaculum aerophilum]